MGSSFVLVAGTLAKGPRWSGNPWYQVRVVVNNVDAVSRLELPSFASHMTVVRYSGQVVTALSVLHVHVWRRAVGRQRLADQVLSGARSKQVEVE